MKWFTRAAESSVKQEVEFSIGEHKLLAEMNVTFNDDGTYVYDPEASLTNVWVEDGGEWARVQAGDIQQIKADESLMRSLYDKVRQAAESAGEQDDDDSEPQDEATVESSFIAASVPQVMNPSALVTKWWASLDDKRKLEVVMESTLIDDLKALYKENLTKMTVSDLRNLNGRDASELYDILWDAWKKKHNEPEPSAEDLKKIEDEQGAEQL